MKKSLLLILLFVVIDSIALGQLVPWSRAPIDTSYESISKDNLELHIEIDKFREETERQYDRINWHIGAATLFLTIFGIIFAIAGIVLGVYVSKVWRQVEKAKDEQKDILLGAENIRLEVKSLSDSINSNLQKIFLDFKRREVEHALSLIEADPRNINIAYITLATNKLKKADFEILSKPLLTSIQELPYPNGAGMFLHLITSNFLEKITEERAILEAVIFNRNIIQSLCSKKEFSNILITLARSKDQAIGIMSLQVGLLIDLFNQYDIFRKEFVSLLGSADASIEFLETIEYPNRRALLPFKKMFLQEIVKLFQNEIDSLFSSQIDSLIKQIDKEIYDIDR